MFVSASYSVESLSISLASLSRSRMGKIELKKGPWTREEDQKLLTYIEKHGHGGWRVLPSKAGLQRCGKSCRMRWTNYLSPEIKRGKFTAHEEKTIIRLHALLGNRWSAIANHLPKRTDNEIKNYWNTRLKKRLVRMGFDPVTHKPKNNTTGGSAQSLSHMAQWETARLEAEVRLVREAKQFTNRQLLRRATTPPPVIPPPPRCLDVLRVWQETNDNNIPPHHNGNFFDSFESPTSTLHFSGSINRVPPILINNITNFCASAVEEENSYSGEEKCKIENSMQFHHREFNANPLDYDMLTSSSMNFQNQSYDSYDILTSDFDNWDDELLNLVNLPTSIAF